MKHSSCTRTFSNKVGNPEDLKFILGTPQGIAVLPSIASLHPDLSFDIGKTIPDSTAQKGDGVLPKIQFSGLRIQLMSDTPQPQSQG